MGNDDRKHSPPVNKHMDFVTKSQPQKQRYDKAKSRFLIYKKPILIVAIATAVMVGGISLAVNLFSKNDNKNALTGVAASYAKQLPELSTAVKKDPNNAEARKNYAVALYATKDLKAAKEQYEKAAELNNKDSTVYNNLGNVYRDLGEIDKAVNAYRKSIELGPTSINPYINLANVQLYTQNKPDDAIATYQQALTKLPGNEQIELLMGIAYEQKGDTNNAKKTYQNILSRNPGNAAAKANLERLNKE